MIETPLKRDEQYPLLKVDPGGGDNGGRMAGAEVPSVYHVATPKSGWRDRWPEFVSACWMTVVILGISSLAFFSLGLLTYTRQIIIVKCNNSKPASDVFYHNIVQRGNNISFTNYSNYLSDISRRYPALRFNVFFFLDDTVRAPTYARFFNFSRQLDEYNRRELKTFQRRHSNVNITIISISKFMTTTSMRYKWRTIPIVYLPFYIRIYSVWQYGGIGLDLEMFKNQYIDGKHFDTRIDVILKQHNDGIHTDTYINKLNKINHDMCEINDFFKFMLLYMNQILTYFNNSHAVSGILPEKDNNEMLIRTHRNKRDVSNNSSTIDASYTFVELQPPLNVINNSITDIKIERNNQNKTATESYITKTNVTLKNKKSNVNATKIKKDLGINKTETPQVIFIYDLSVFSDGIGSFNVLSEPLYPNTIKVGKGLDFNNAKRSKDPLLLVLDPTGVFVAASTRLHPFLGHLISTSCTQTHPKFVIGDALSTQCAGIFTDDFYCNNIYIL